MPQWLEIVMWTIISFTSLFFITKMIGKRQMNQMTFFDYITGIAMGEIGAHMAMHLENKVINSIIALSLFAIFPVLIGWGSLKSHWIRQFVNGKARALIQKGEILTDNLAKERMTREELMARLRLKNVYQVADVELALMENDGNISVRLSPESSPLTLDTIEEYTMRGQKQVTVDQDETQSNLYLKLSDLTYQLRQTLENIQDIQREMRDKGKV